MRVVHSHPLTQAPRTVKLVSYGIATVHDGTLERMDVSGAPGVRWEEREDTTSPAVTASSKRTRDMVSKAHGKVEVRKHKIRFLIIFN